MPGNRRTSASGEAWSTETERQPLLHGDLAEPVGVVVAVGDAKAISQADDSFDAAVSGLVLNFLSDKAAAIREMTRIVRPGGIVGLYVWDYAGHMQPMRTFFDVATALDARSADCDDGVKAPICRPEPLIRHKSEAGWAVRHLRDDLGAPIKAQTIDLATDQVRHPKRPDIPTRSFQEEKAFGQQVDSMLTLTLVAARTRLVRITVELSNQIRGIMKTFGLLVPAGKGTTFEKNVRSLLLELTGNELKTG